MTRLKILLVDDDAEFVHRFGCLGEEMFDIVSARSGLEAIEKARRESPDAVLLDIDLGAEPNGLEVLRRLRAEDPDLPIIMVSGDDRPETIVAAMKAGANDYVTKRPHLEVLHLKVQRALDESAWRVHAREMQASAAGELLGSSPAMKKLRDEILRVGPMRIRVLIRGESGTGKELVAAALHATSPRRREKIVAASGPAGTDELFDSELFGHEKGAFTGAERRRRGKFELASGGTLFIDEIGRMPLPRQAKLLRAIETGRIERLGGTETVSCDVRLLTASNEGLEGKILRGEFYEDLFYRIAEYELRVPPLRDRKIDIPELARALADRFTRSENLPSLVWREGALLPLWDHDWPGNVRELDSLLKCAAILAQGVPLTADLVRTALEVKTGRQAAQFAAGAGVAGLVPSLQAAPVPDGALATPALAHERNPAPVEAEANLGGAASTIDGARAVLHEGPSAFEGTTPLPSDGHDRGGFLAECGTSRQFAEQGSPSDQAPLGAFLGEDYRTSRARLEQVFDRLFVERELRRTGGNVTRAAQRLGVSRATLNRWLGDLGLKGFDPTLDDA